VSARGILPHGWAGSHGLALVRRGLVIRQRVDEQGLAFAVDVVGPGGVLPLRDEGRFDLTGYALSDAMICLLPRDRFDAGLAAGAPTAGELFALHAAALERVERIAQARSRATTVARVGALLATLADVLAPPRRLTCLPTSIQQRDLAALLAVRHESVCRAIRSLESRGALARDTEGIRLVDRAKLDG
jgi:CRP-like cAMP-binding protein